LIRTGGQHPLRIQFPLNGSQIDAGAAEGKRLSSLPVRVAGGVFPMTLLINGKAVGEIESRRQRMVEPPGPGFIRLTVMDAVGAADTVTIRIQ
jgi:penicillin-binding protein 1C